MPRREVAAGVEGDGAHGIVDHRLERSDVTVRLMQMNPDGFNCSNDKKGAVAEQILMRAAAHKVHYLVITELHRPEPERLRVLLNFYGFTRAVYAPRVGEDETDRVHGGVAILIHKDAPCKIVAVGCGEERDACTDTSIEFPRGGDHVCVAGRALVNDDDVCCGEFVTVEMLHDDQPFTLRAAYVRPMQPMTAALWDTLLRGADVVAGDFNAVHSTWCSKATITKGAQSGAFYRGLELNKALSRNGCRVLKLTSTAAGEQRDCTHTAVEATNAKVEGSTIDLFIVRRSSMASE